MLENTGNSVPAGPPAVKRNSLSEIFSGYFFQIPNRLTFSDFAGGLGLTGSY